MTELSTLYRTDYSALAQRNAELLRSGRYAELDVEHLLEELSDMGKSEGDRSFAGDLSDGMSLPGGANPR